MTSDAPGDDLLPEPPLEGGGLFGDVPPVEGGGLFGDVPPPEGGGLFGDVPPATAPAAASAAPPAIYRVLARKYRPVSFDDMIGQEATVRILRRAFATGRVAHAFMLTGVRGVGKTTTARIIARALSCIGADGTGSPTGDPCGVCANCVAILADRHPDVMEMDAASRTGIDDVREIIEATRFRPMLARGKVFIIDEVHMLSRNAFNALLKTLEEPPAHVTFIFATTELRKVPVTVLSRCQRFDLRRVPQEALAGLFGRIAANEGVEVVPDALTLLARAADGSVRDGLSLLDQAIAQAEAPVIEAAAIADMLGLADRTLVFDLLDAALGGRAAEALRLSGDMFDRGADPGLVLTDLLELVHTLTRLKTVPALAGAPELPELERVRGGAMAERLSIPVLSRAWQMLLKGIGEVEQAPARQEAAEMVLIRLCYSADLPPPGELVRRLSDGAAQGQVPGRLPPGSTQPSPAPSSPAQSPPQAQGGVSRGNLAVAEAAPSPAAPPPTSEAAPLPATWRAVVALVAARREPSLHGNLRHCVHPVRVAPPVLEIRVQEGAPRDLASRLAAVLSDATGARWTVALSRAPGEPTLAEQEQVVRDAGRAEAAQHPIVREILRLFPGAAIATLHDRTLDAYGLPPLPEPLSLGGEAATAPDTGPGFAPIDAERAFDVMPPDPEDMELDP